MVQDRSLAFTAKLLDVEPLTEWTKRPATDDDTDETAQELNPFSPFAAWRMCQMALAWQFGFRSRVLLLDAISLDVIREVAHLASENIWSVAYAPDGARFAVQATRSIWAFDAASCAPVKGCVDLDAMERYFVYEPSAADAAALRTLHSKSPLHQENQTISTKRCGCCRSAAV